MKKISPASIEAEQSLLGGILLDAEVLPTALAVVSAEDFYRAAHRTIFSAIGELYDQAEPCDIVIITNHLRAQGKLEEAGGIDYLAGLVDCVPSAKNVGYYAQIVKEKAGRRKIIAEAYQIAESAQDGRPLEALLADIHEVFSGVETTHRIQRIPTPKDLLNELLTERVVVKDKGGLGLDPGFKFIKKAIKALRQTHLWMIGGYTSVGKTQLAVELTRRVLQHNPGSTVAIFSLEMSRLLYTLRLLAAYSNVHADKYSPRT